MSFDRKKEVCLIKHIKQKFKKHSSDRTRRKTLHGVSKKWVCVCLCLTCILGLCGCTPKNTSYSKNNLFFDTIITITVYDPDHVSYIQDCFDLASYYENLLSRTKEGSDIFKINHANGGFVEVQDETIELLNIGLHYCQLSNGAFDITVGALSDVWDFKNNEGIVPSGEAIDAALQTVGYENILIDGNKVALKNPNTCIDLGGIAKGYIADKMKDCLSEKGVTSAIINLGGNVLLVGGKTDGTSYTIGIQKPFEETGTALGAVDIKDCSLVSSGVYERYFTTDGKLYHHILDTSTGYPIENGLYGVTIISEQSVDGDALSTTIFALGLEEGIRLVERLDNTEAIFVTNEMETITTSGIGREISFRLLDSE